METTDIHQKPVSITKTDRHGRPYHIVNNRQDYGQLRQLGRVVFTTKELEMCGQIMQTAGDHKQQLADCIMQVKQTFKGSFLKEVTA